MVQAAVVEAGDGRRSGAKRRRDADGVAGPKGLEPRTVYWSGMAHEQLQRASEELRAAAEAAGGEIRERLERQADQFAKLAESGADHGRLARHENALREIEAEASEGVSDHVAAAKEAITAYRETIEGV